MNLYQIAEQYREVLSWDIENELDAEALCALLDEVAGRIEDKAEAVVHYMRNLEADATAYKMEEERLKANRLVVEKRAEKLKKYLEFVMRRLDRDEIKANLVSMKFVKNPWAVEVEPTADIPNQYLRFRDPEPDKALIKEALISGIEVPGCRLVQTERLRIT